MSPVHSFVVKQCMLTQHNIVDASCRLQPVQLLQQLRLPVGGVLVRLRVQRLYQL
jgi:hypothetical protein